MRTLTGRGHTHEHDHPQPELSLCNSGVVGISLICLLWGEPEGAETGAL